MYVCTVWSIALQQEKCRMKPCLMKIVEKVTKIVENTKSGSVTMDGDTSEMCVHTNEEARLG